MTLIPQWEENGGSTMILMLKKLPALVIALAFALGLFAAQALPALACGGLVAPNGAIRLSRAATLVAWHDGIERYMTSFTYQGDVANFGWIVPLPAVPLKIEEGGAWTLQRLFRETHPQEFLRFAAASTASGNADDSAQVLQKVKIEALNITVIRGSGQAVLNWATTNGFYLDGETRAHLLIYAQGSPIFMAAKYDTAAARARGQLQGDGAPVLITMKTAHPWVPLEVLTLGNPQVKADLYLLTDQRVYVSDRSAALGQPAVNAKIPDAPGFRVAFQEKLTPTLFHDLSTDRNMSWVRPDSWLTYLSLDAPGTTITYDMGISSAGVIRLAPYGTHPMAVVDSYPSQEPPTWVSVGSDQLLFSLVFLLGVGGAFFAIVWVTVRSRAKQGQ